MKLQPIFRWGPRQASRQAPGQASVAERRRHPRVQLNLPVRLRWQTPLGHLTEVTETLEVSRGGLLLRRREPCRVHAMLWVTFPYDSTLPLGQLETPARVARVEDLPSKGYLMAMEFEEPLRSAARGGASGAERRRQERVPLALPIRVRPADSPWPEETMTMDITEEGVHFWTTRLYSVGDAVRISLPGGSLPSRWITTAELPARVVRVVCRPGSIEQEVAVALLPPAKP
jgi:PilZ domain